MLPEVVIPAFASGESEGDFNYMHTDFGQIGHRSTRHPPDCGNAEHCRAKTFDIRGNRCDGRYRTQLLEGESHFAVSLIKAPSTRRARTGGFSDALLLPRFCPWLQAGRREPTWEPRADAAPRTAGGGKK